MWLIESIRIHKGSNGEGSQGVSGHLKVWVESVWYVVEEDREPVEGK